jgi:hypothetical protein
MRGKASGRKGCASGVGLLWFDGSLRESESLREPGREWGETCGMRV